MSLLPKAVVLLALVLTITALPSGPLVGKKAHGAFCHLCEDLIKDGKEAGDVELDLWLDEEIGTRCKDFGALAAECLKELKVAEKDIQEAIDKDIPEEKTCKEVKLC
uniref:Saposin B-type domain-containing protein n=1 Tax=Caenorhabditis japonica TaxID=281687 RepID=A0A2Q4TJN7_CAEJA